MLIDAAAPGLVTLALLHEGGWDEVIMVAVGLGVAYLVILWSGRRKSGDDDEYEDDDIADGDANGEPTADREAGRQAASPPRSRSADSTSGTAD